MATLLEVSLSIAWAEHFAQGPAAEGRAGSFDRDPRWRWPECRYSGNRRKESGRCRREADIADRDDGRASWWTSGGSNARRRRQEI